jgi:thymidylate synthase (FAD)
VEALYKEHYEKLIAEGKSEKQAKAAAEKASIEDARYVFPNACETKIVLTMTARALMNFFSHRCCQRAQWEIRELAEEMLKQVKLVAPTLFKNAGPSCLTAPCPEGAMSCGKITDVREKFKNLNG